MFGKVRLAFGTILENLRKSSESALKSSENHPKRRHQYVYIIRRTLHVNSKIWILCPRGKNNILHSFAALTREILFLPLEHKIHISSRHRVISSIYSVFNASVPLNSSFNIQLFIQCSTFYSTFNDLFNVQLFIQHFNQHSIIHTVFNFLFNIQCSTFYFISHFLESSFFLVSD